MVLKKCPWMYENVPSSTFRYRLIKLKKLWYIHKNDSKYSHKFIKMCVSQNMKLSKGSKPHKMIISQHIISIIERWKSGKTNIELLEIFTQMVKYREKQRTNQ